MFRNTNLTWPRAVLWVLLSTVACEASFATCIGASPCNACKNCKYCRHCAQEGGTCGVCRGVA
jgi:hypothetical protein